MPAVNQQKAAVGRPQPTSAAPPAPGGLSEALAYTNNVVEGIRSITNALGVKLAVYPPSGADATSGDGLNAFVASINSQLTDIANHLVNINSAI